MLDVNFHHWFHHRTSTFTIGLQNISKYFSFLPNRTVDRTFSSLDPLSVVLVCVYVVESSSVAQRHCALLQFGWRTCCDGIENSLKKFHHCPSSKFHHCPSSKSWWKYWKLIKSDFSPNDGVSAANITTYILKKQKRQLPSSNIHVFWVSWWNPHFCDEKWCNPKKDKVTSGPFTEFIWLRCYNMMLYVVLYKMTD